MCNRETVGKLAKLRARSVYECRAGTVGIQINAHAGGKSPTGDNLTVADARADYLARNGFSTAAYEARWFRVPGLPFPLPNVRSRRRAIRFHDLHHVLTGYDTTWVGEAEIGAWEIAATYPDRGFAYWAAWMLNFSLVTIGLVIAPRRVLRAFRRGRRCTSVYRLGWSEELLAAEVDDVRHRIGLITRPAA